MPECVVCFRGRTGGPGGVHAQQDSAEQRLRLCEGWKRIEKLFLIEGSVLEQMQGCAIR